MKIILIEDVQNLGYKDDVVEVKNGYGLNYLIPQKKAIIATESNLKQLNEKLKQQAQKRAKIKADAEAVAEKIKGLVLEVAVKASEEGKVYGSVTNIQLAEAFAAAGAEIDRKLIVVEPAKTLGEHTCTVKLHREVCVEVPFNVVAAATE